MVALANASSDISDLNINHDRLGFAFCLALALHAAFILGVSFTRDKPVVASPKLEITLAQHRSQKAPEEADFLAQSNQQGSGILLEKAMLTTQKIVDYQDTTIREVTQEQQIKHSDLQKSSRALVTSITSSAFKSDSQQQEEKTSQDNEQQLNDAILMQRSVEIASLEAKLDIQRQAYAKRPRVRRLTSVATKQSDDALYLHNWRTKVEAIGNLHYPNKAKQTNLFGKLRMVVSLLPNGDVYQVKILQSSGHKILDQAALKIVHLAAPYDPFPQKMQRSVDVLEIIRTWRFHKDTLSSSS
jgi:protein TonB